MTGHQLEATLCITKVMSWADNVKVYDEKRDQQSRYWLNEGPMASVPCEMCSLCGSSILNESDKRCEAGIDCAVRAKRDRICERCMPTIGGNNYCLYCVNEGKPQRNGEQVPSEVRRWIDLLQPDEVSDDEKLHDGLLRKATITWPRRVAGVALQSVSKRRRRYREEQ